MEWAQLPIVQGGAAVLLAAFVWLIGTGRLVPRSVLEDARKDRDERIAQAEKDRDERIAEAEKDAERGWKLYEKEQASHSMTRRALVDQALGVALPSIAVAETAEKILTELQAPGSGDD
ncbi:hypothetical protein ACIBCT_21285 [Streptosporangium sp. NPDC050855]|uniref:hypothetical protein n=1 Tax=Streptosporangium sp. NPDC050855 TaxID=3366194 RepID=UPI0037B38873